MNFECLRDCSSTELLTAQKHIGEILKTRRERTKFAENCSKVVSRSSSKCSGKGRHRRKSVNYNFTSTKSNARRSQSLINLRDDSSVSTCVESINKKYQQTYNDNHFRFEESEAEAVTVKSDGEDDATEKSVSLSTSLSHVTYSKAQESYSRSKQHEKLSNTVKRLHVMLDDVHGSTTSPYRHRSRSRSAFFEKKQIPRIYEKGSITKLARIADTLTKSLHTQVSNLIVLRRKEKTRLEESRNDNAILKQRFNNSLTIQRNLEGELRELNKEKKLLEVENKNLAIKIVPFLNESTKANNKNEPATGSTRRGGAFCHNVLDDDTKNNNSLAMGSENNCKNCHQSSSALDSDSIFRCSRRSSLDALNVRSWYTNDEDDTSPISQSVSDSNLTVDSTTEDFSKADEIVNRTRGKKKDKSRADLDKIASYVRWKSQDFNRLHGRLHKSFEELQELKQTMNLMSQEKSEILGDLEDLVDSYRELERERDNYESILKMILKEKNSSESNIRHLLDGLLVHLNNPKYSSPTHQCHQHDCCPTSSSDAGHHHHHCPNSRSFLESALHVIQEQNISIREEMARLRESLQNTTGQNTVLQANNETLMAKVNDLQRQMESKEAEAELKEKEHKEKFEHLDKLYNTISSAKDDLESRLQEKEKEIARLNLKNVTDASDKALKDQAEKIAELKETNVKMEKDIARLKTINEKLTQMVKQVKTESKEQKGKYSDQLKSTNNDLQKSKEQCNWLQNQVENFKIQLHDAHERIKLQEKDKSILAHKVLAEEEERKTLDRNIQEIRTVMEADKLYQQALAERNEVLQLEINRLRTEKLSGDSMHESIKCEQSGSVKKNGEDGDGSGETKLNNSVKTAVSAVKNKDKPKKAAVPSPGNRNNSVAKQRPATAKPGCCSRHNCGVVRPATAKATPTCTAAQRTAAAKRLSTALANRPRQPAEYTPRLKGAASSGPQDSTQKPSISRNRTTVSSHSIGNKNANNSLLCTAGKRPLVALVRVKRRPLIIH